MAIGTVVAFWAVSFMFVITPGADWAYAISAGLRNRTVLPAVGGMLSGHLLAALVVAAGVGALVAGAPVLLTVLTIAGCAYLVWLGIGLLRRPAAPYAGEAVGEAESPWRQVLTGFGVSGLNPKVFILFVALVPQFADAHTNWPIGVQILVLGLVHIASSALVYTGVGAGARVVLRARPSVARIVTRCSGAAMILVGIALFVERLVTA
ncbi:LysE family translocator [Paramicrobacterium humi]|uniref:LysE family translocator n=1 Tax=Paramicrobacterium humi TaxID=640635 RepID=UPI000B8246BD|nr:LysE family translocator [Microbacterium humi]